ncbi:MAG: anthranilate phosphoribosyltransferase [Gemmataceae bacterium]
MHTTASFSFREALETLLARQPLSPRQIEAAFQDVLSGECGEAETAALLIALRMKGEEAEEIAGAARVLRQLMIPLDTGGLSVVDTSGTGGDGTGTFNVSTASAFVVAGAGVPVVKHGNRSVSSTSGSADVLTALGIHLVAGTEWPALCLREAGMAFCFAPYFHPVMACVASLRQRLGVRTIFNCLGPLLNPAGAVYQIVGVGKPELLDSVAGAVARLGTQRTFVVCGRDGLDEVSLSAPTLVREVCGSTVTAHEWRPDDFGLSPCQIDDIKVAGPADSARLIRQVLDGVAGPAQGVVLANAAAALWAAGRVASLREGVMLARDAIVRGKARRVLDRLTACSPVATEATNSSGKG